MKYFSVAYMVYRSCHHVVWLTVMLLSPPLDWFPWQPESPRRPGQWVMWPGFCGVVVDDGLLLVQGERRLMVWILKYRLWDFKHFSQTEEVVELSHVGPKWWTDSLTSPTSVSISQTSSGLPGGSLVLPVLNVPRSQFHLRADILLLLREADIATEILVFRDEVDLARLHGDRRLALTLVDHNVLPRSEISQHQNLLWNVHVTFLLIRIIIPCLSVPTVAWRGR